VAFAITMLFRFAATRWPPTPSSPLAALSLTRQHNQTQRIAPQTQGRKGTHCTGPHGAGHRTEPIHTTMSSPEPDYSEIPSSPESPGAPAQQTAPVPGLPLTELTPERIALAVQQTMQAEAKVQPVPTITEWHEIDEADYAN